MKKIVLAASFSLFIVSNLFSQSDFSAEFSGGQFYLLKLMADYKAKYRLITTALETTMFL